MRILITGVTGFAGSHLLDLLVKQKKVEIHGTYRWRSKLEKIQHNLDKIELHECDLRDMSSVRRTLNSVKPDIMFHLAAQTFVPMSWDAPVDTYETNVLAQVNIMEYYREAKDTCRLIVPISSEIYGQVYRKELPVRETNTLRPLSPYSVSKAAQDMVCYQYFRSHKVDSVRIRAFNHDGPRRDDVFVWSNFAKQIAVIEKGLKPPVIRVGNLDPERDYVDVRDMVRAYWLASQKCPPGEVYNVCTGKAKRIGEYLEQLVSNSKIKLKVVVDKQRFRPTDTPVMVGDYSKFKKATGWVPEIEFRQTLKDLLNYWRERV
ncbi:MAG: GDP-mannose 4,6-dehydratase [Elusimicrobiota bacterium]